MFLIALSIGVSLVAVELVSLVVSKLWLGTTRPLLLDLQGTTAAPRFHESARYSTLDPLLGYAARSPFVVHGEESAGAAVIVTLGGSTTDGQYQPESWPKQLQRILGAERPLVVRNGGVVGYSTNQELLKLLRDVRPLAPSLVVTLDGENDIGLYSASPEHPMIHPYQEQLFRYLTDPVGETVILPNSTFVLRTLLRRIFSREPLIISHGVETHQSAAAQWEQNVRTMNAICKELGYRYLDLLQPALGYGKYELSPDERRMLADAEAIAPGYQQSLSRFYDDARRRCAALPFCDDLTDSFASVRSVYEDARHPNARGHELIAGAAASEIRLRKLLP
jgi:lysophospholipase L1-like esterase